MVRKELLAPGRVRRIPHGGFSWIDRRFVRDGFVDALQPSEVILYFFLCAVSDGRGLSFWSDSAVGRILHLSRAALSAARDALIRTDLIAYRRPLYQVLSLPERPPMPAPSTPEWRSGCSPARRRGYAVGAARLFCELQADLLSQFRRPDRNVGGAHDRGPGAAIDGV